MENRNARTVSPSILVNAVFYNNGKILCKSSQFRFDSDEGGEYVVFTENGSKNRSGSYKDKADNKIVKQYAQLQLKEHVMCTFFAVILVNYQKLRMNGTFSTGDQGIVHLLMR